MARTSSLEHQRGTMQVRVAVGAVAVLAALAIIPAASAQQQPVQQAPSRPVIQTGPTGAPIPPAAPPAQKRQAPARDAGAATESRGGDQALRSKIEQLEEQVIDLQVAIGTLESLARAPGSAAPAAAGGFRTLPSQTSGGDPVRVESLEVQLRALVAQMERLADRVTALEGGRPAPTAAPAAPVSGPPARPAGQRASQPEIGFGQTIVTPGGTGGGDAIGSLLRDDPAGAPPSPGRQAALGDPGTGGNPKQLYETAYGYLLQQDYGAAEAAFTEFLGQHP